MKFLTSPYPTVFEIFQALLVCIAVTVAFLKPNAFERVFLRIETKLRWLSARPRLSFFAAAALPLVLRAILLPVYGVPEPGIHDEHAFLLQAKTFAAGRWTNPTPPLPEFFETIYVLVRPTYTAQYPPAAAAVMAIAQLLTGVPWLGVFFAMGLACGLFVWMLRGYVRPVWALAGALIAAFQFGVLSYWMNSYFGGVVPCIGGTLVFGGLARLRGRPAIRASLAFACGIAILIHSRPQDAYLLFLCSLAALVYWVLFEYRLPWHRRFLNVIVPVGSVLAVSAGLLFTYNIKVTGKPADLPYLLNQEQYGTPQGFYFERDRIVDRLPNQQLRDEYLVQLKLHQRRNSFRALLAGTFGRLRMFWGFFITPVFAIPLIFIPFIWNGPLRRVLPIIAVLHVLVFLAFFAYLPQYSAPIASFILLVLVYCLQRLRVANATGLFLSRALPLICVASVLVPIAGRYLQPALPAAVAKLWAGEFGVTLYRQKFLRQLIAQGGRHLVVVHYLPTHQVDTEWVYNDPDIPNSPVIWARELGPDSAAKLIAQFPGRKVWIGEPDSNPPALVPYVSSPLP